MINAINNIACLWWSWMAAMFWQVGLLIILVACIDTLIKRWAWPQLRYALWLLVLIKLVLPPGVSMPGSLAERVKPPLDWLISRNINKPSTITKYTPFIVSPEPLVAARQATVRQPQVTFSLQKPESGVVTSSAVVPEAPVIRPYTALVQGRLVWQSYAMAIWLFGMTVLGSWLILRLNNLRACQSRNSSASAMPQSFHLMMSRCARQLKLRRVPCIVVTKKVVCPAVFGIFRPVLLMPKGYLSRLSRKDAEHVLLHELAHIKRGDPIVHSLYLILQIVYWFNPLLWLARRQLIHLRELCCDTTVARILKNKTNEYRETLIDIARQFLTRPVEPGLGLLGLFEDTNRLLVRLSWLEKKTWRYQKMKNLTVITIMTFMLAFVLPMAKAQEQSSADDHSAHIQQTENLVSDLHNDDDTDAESVQRSEQLSQQMQTLEAQLEKLETERQNLRKELAALEKSRLAADKAKDLASDAVKKVKAAKDKSIKESADMKKALQLAEQWQNSDEFKQWQKQVQQWQNSEEFKQWQQQMQDWQSKMQQWQQQVEQSMKKYQMSAEAGEHPGQAPTPHPAPQIPHMPPMPPMPSMPSIPTAGPLPALPEGASGVVVPGVTVPGDIPKVVTPKVNIPTIKVPVNATAPVVTVPSSGHIERQRHPDINVNNNEDNKFVATREMEFDTKIEPGAPLVVQNKIGKIILKPSQDRNCTVKAVIRATAETAEKAQEMVEQVAMNNQSSSEKFFLMPVKSGDDDWSNLNVDLLITVPSGVSIDVSTDVGSLEMTDLSGQIKGFTNVGKIKAVNVVGEIQLTTKVGDIEVVAPKDLSAKLQATTKIGSIESDFPLNVSKTDITASMARGTIGSGEKDIKLITEVGKIRIKKPSLTDN
jgi:beta-lactamase regulating signal transducer with metallopeptidase domain